jgi:hypothetical protein
MSDERLPGMTPEELRAICDSLNDDQESGRRGNSPICAVHRLSILG